MITFDGYIMDMMDKHVNSMVKMVHQTQDNCWIQHMMIWGPADDQCLGLYWNTIFEPSRAMNSMNSEKMYVKVWNCRTAVLEMILCGFIDVYYYIQNEMK